MIADNNGDTPKDYLREIASGQNCPLGELLVMARNNDPFNCGSPTDRAQAEWFAGIWQAMNFRRGTHLRAIHYAISHGKGKHTTHDGTTYENTEDCWNYLGDASKKARYLGLVDAAAFSDQRNPEPVENAPEFFEPEPPECSIEPFSGFRIPTVKIDLEAAVELPTVQVDGYEYHPGEQQVYLEVWCEKSTMNYVLEPVCRRYDANLITAMGFSSVTAVIRLLSRVAAWLEHGRPVRIFYISDFDPAGDSMPRAVARQLEFWLWKFDIEADIKLMPIALTAEQVERYQLPRKPIKKSDRRKDAFEQRRGGGAVELDALEGVHPGELERLLSSSLRRYRDYDCESRIDDAWWMARQVASEAWESHTADIAARVAELRQRAQEVIDRFRPRLEQLATEFEAELSPVREEIEIAESAIRDEIEAAANSLTIELPARPRCYVELPDESDWLFDSTREPLEQLQHYREHFNGQ